MENRSVFALHGLTGGLIATGLLLAILAYLSVLAIGVQQEEAETFYVIENADGLQKISTDNANHYKVVKKGL